MVFLIFNLSKFRKHLEEQLQQLQIGGINSYKISIQLFGNIKQVSILDFDFYLKI